MPIRMTDDEPGDDQNDDDSNDSGGGGDDNGGGGGGGGGGGDDSSGIWALFSAIGFFFRHPILSLIIAAVLGVLYLVGGHSSGGGATHASKHAKVALGATLDQKVYDTAKVNEPLAESGPNGLPSKVSLLEDAPPRLNQGHQGSCVGWATSYAARTILYSRQTGTPAQSIAFSPSFAYNAVGARDCNGTYLVKALTFLRDVGDLPLAQFAYDQDSCQRKPNDEEKEKAERYRLAGFTRLTVDTGDYRTDSLAVKQHLAQGAPVVIGMEVGGTFESDMMGQRVWHPTHDDYNKVGDWGGHAMAVIGYDDTVEGGAFQLMNSWGDDWGDHGTAFVKYKDFDHFVQEAYGLYPMGDGRRDKEQRIHFGLLETKTNRRLSLTQDHGIVFKTVEPIHAGTRFKVEYSNTKPTYTYLFGQETDGSSYVLFPYTDKNSPYCGTTGTRIFPRKQSLTADDKGTRDAVAVVISPKELDYHDLNARISAAAGAGYADKLIAALGPSLSSKAKVRAKDDSVELVAGSTEDDKVHALVLEFDKN